MSSLVRRLSIRAMKRAGYSREKWIIVANARGEPEPRTVRCGGVITDPDDTPIGRLWPTLIPARIKMPTKPAKRHQGPPRGSRRGTRSKKYIEARKAIRARAAQGGDQ